MHTVQDLNSGQPGAIDSPGGEATGPVLQL